MIKFPKPAPDHVLAFARRSLAQLPDELTRQRADLAVLVQILPRQSDSRKAAMEMLAALLLAEQARRDFCFPADQRDAGPTSVTLDPFNKNGTGSPEAGGGANN